MNVNTDSTHHELCNIFRDLRILSNNVEAWYMNFRASLLGHHYGAGDRLDLDEKELIHEARNAWRLALMIEEVLVKHSARMFNEGALYGGTHGERF